VLSVTFLLYFLSKNSTRSSQPRVEDAVAPLKQEQINSGLPVRLRIPGINVDSVIEYVGLTSDGAMDVPKDPDDVAWYKLGQRPGEIGSAVIAGHYGTWKNGKGSVFDNLYKLRKGDKIYVEDNKGTNTAFVVRESRRYDPKADASDVFISDNGKAHLNLITCEGTWNKVSKSYSQRLVVFTDKE
jgi:LPXTG-site transpeptidase (sortase) family protein